MRLLLDTCVLSELHQAAPNQRVLAAIDACEDEDLYISVVSIGEIAKGIGLLPTGGRRRLLQAWLMEMERDFADRILDVDLETVRMWGEITATARRSGKQIAIPDGMIAATARRHGLSVMTRNTRDFEPTGVSVVNPWKA